ncbi:hypothetical protein, partial [Stenotrophomonas maltophilia]|uniref:hypothetical protein n=1 Tax=Stenotrophomonas maltophilia TaxID=40324 RepID=UPI0034E2BA0B
RPQQPNKFKKIITKPKKNHVNTKHPTPTKQPHKKKKKNKNPKQPPTKTYVNKQTQNDQKHQKKT